MTDKNDSDKGAAKGGDPRRPHATIDLQATEVGGKGRTERTAAGGRSSALPPPGARTDSRPGLAARVAGAGGWARRAAQSNTFLSHLAAGVAGAVVTLAVTALTGLLLGDGEGRQVASDIDRRVASLEQTMRQRTPSSEVTAKLAQTDARLKGVEDQTRAVAALSDAQAKLAASVKSLEGRGASPELVNRLAKVETALTALSAGDRGTPAAALADKLNELEKQVGDAVEATKSGAARVDRDVGTVKTETSRLSQRLDALKSDIDERFRGTAKSADVAAMTARLGAFEHDLQGLLRDEGERSTNTARVLLALEVANLKRAMDRGGSYAAELEAVRKVAGNSLDLAPLQRYSLEGAPTMAALSKDFRHVANAAIDAEEEPADGSVLERLMSGARSIVRVRKAGHTSDDTSTEAVIGRMETALKEGRLGEVLEQGRKLPPKAELAAADWLKKVEARHAVDRSLAAIETALKSSLSARQVPAEPKR